jgi:hypothetical protein
LQLCAILDRFLHHAEIIQITGKSYRLGQAARGIAGMETQAKIASGEASDAAAK